MSESEEVNALIIIVWEDGTVNVTTAEALADKVEQSIAARRVEQDVPTDE